jgi:hypothetical protein
MKNAWIFVVPAWISGTQKPRMAFTAYISVTWIPAIHAGMTLSELGVRLLLINMFF